MSENIITLKYRDPMVCGGTEATLNTDAPKEIKSDEMTFFSVTSALSCPDGTDELGFISAFAAPAGNGTFIFLQKGDMRERSSEWALIKDDVFPFLTSLVKEYNIAKDNGFYSKTYGLPENFGGSVDIEYKSGERIGISNNQSPVLSYSAGKGFAAFFEKALTRKKVSLPSVSSLTSIRFDEEKDGGIFTHSVLTLCGDGTAVNEKSRCFDGKTVYNSKKTVSSDEVSKIKETIESCGLFAWSSLPDTKYSFEDPKTLTFAFDGGKEIKVKNCRRVPEQISGGFFKIELEMTVKH